ncbi:NADPH-dependent FMN reductase [Streptomyces niveus]|uniref:NADPH-dependent FMN reductase n=1 Tax=Streptomyces niveus TaxID=193462 RepID=A0A1U9QX42_STRNV|nr:NADPH-dependent FMN reductase [Streptomyces niveus]
MDITTHDPATGASPHSPRTPALQAPLGLAVIMASNREGRFGPVVSDWFVSRATGRTDFTVDLIDLADTDLPTALSFSPPVSVRGQLGKVTHRLAEADAFVIVTPEYNHSYPASLKVLIDWHFDEWRAKPVGFVSYGGISGGLRAVEHLRQVFAELHAVAVRDTVSFHNAGALFDDEGRHRDPSGAEAAATAMLDQIAWWGLALRDAKSARAYAG